MSTETINTIEYKRSYDLLPLLLANIKEAIFRMVMPDKSLPEFPKKIGLYHFKKTIKKKGPRKSYQLALYETVTGKKAVAKMRNTRVKGYHYYSLLNEITLYKLLGTVVKRVKNRLPKEFVCIVIPRLITAIETQAYLLALIEFVDGVPAENKSDKEKARIYFTVIDFLSFLGKHMTPAEKKLISKRTAYHYIFLYPFLVVKAMITYPHAIGLIARGIPVFVGAIPALIKRNRIELTHRDLHFMNILVSQKHIALIDLQQCVFTDPFHEFITTIRYLWEDDTLYRLLFSLFLKRHMKEKLFEVCFRGLCVNSVTHGLTGTGYSKKIIVGWLSFLKFGIYPNFIMYL